MEDIRIDFHKVIDKENQSRDCDGSSMGIGISKSEYKKTARRWPFRHHRTNTFLLSLLLNCYSFFLIVKISCTAVCFYWMAQSNWLSKEKVERSLATVTMKLKIKVPHFNNTAVVQGYSKTLMGRCMNPRAHNMNNMLFMLPPIWNVEERVVGADLGLGRFKFDFDRRRTLLRC